MKTEEEDQSDYDFGSRESSTDEVAVKELSFPLSPSSNGSPPPTSLTTWPYTLLTPQSLVNPSQLAVRVKRPSPASSTTESAAKKVKRKARTEEEKLASAYERTMRNRRAAQESRDRKKRQMEALEEENRLLQEENLNMKRRIEQLESQQQQQQQQSSHVTTPTYTDDPALPYSTDDPVIIKDEVFSPESFESTFHPAAMEFDQQCPSNSLKITSTPTSTLSFYSPLNPSILWTIVCLQPIFSTLFSLTTQISLSERLAHSPATFNSLNTGSLFTGAENGLCIGSRQGLVV
jgi:hypothetical protein